MGLPSSRRRVTRGGAHQTARTPSDGECAGARAARCSRAPCTHGSDHTDYTWSLGMTIAARRRQLPKLLQPLMNGSRHEGIGAHRQLATCRVIVLIDSAVHRARCVRRAHSNRCPSAPEASRRAACSRFLRCSRETVRDMSPSLGARSALYLEARAPQPALFSWGLGFSLASARERRRGGGKRHAAERCPVPGSTRTGVARGWASTRPDVATGC